MCNLIPLHVFKVADPRLDVALKAIQESRKVISTEQAYNVFFEMGFGAALNIDEATGNLSINLTKLQYVGVAAALMAAAEMRGEMEWNPDRTDAGPDPVPPVQEIASEPTATFSLS